jgi:hypothetical protein
MKCVDASEFLSAIIPSPPFRAKELDHGPTLVDHNTISICGFTIDVSSTVHEKCTASDIIEGWKLLGDNVDVDSILQPLFIHTVKEVKAIEQCLHEPLLIEALRLCYWFLKCSRIDSKNTFHFKVEEITGRLKGDLENMSKFKTTIKSDLGVVIPARARTVGDEFEKYMGEVPVSLWSIIPELKFAALTAEAGHEVTFDPHGDFLADGMKCEVKEMNDQGFIVTHPDGSMSFEYKKSDLDNSLTIDQEIELFLARKKTQDRVNEGLRQGRIVFMDATHTDTGYFLCDKTSASDPEYHIFHVINGAIETTKHDDSLSVVITSGSAIECDDEDCRYRIAGYATYVTCSRD